MCNKLKGGYEPVGIRGIFRGKQTNGSAIGAGSLHTFGGVQSLSTGDRQGAGGGQEPPSNHLSV